MSVLQDMVVTRVNGEYYAVPVRKATAQFSGMIRMNKTGKRIFELLMATGDENETVQQLNEEYDVDEATARKNVCAILDKLRSADVL